MSRNFSGLEYGNCRDFTHGQMQMQCFIHLKVNFEKKNPVLPIEKFSSDNVATRYYPFFSPLSIKWSLTGC